MENYLKIVANSSWRWHGAAHTLHSTFARSHGAFAFKGASRGGEHNVGQFSGLGIEKILHQKEFQPAQPLQSAIPVGLRVSGIFTQHVECGEVAVIHRLEHIAQVPAAFGLDLHTPRLLKLDTQAVVLNMLKTRKAVRNGAHISAALDVVLPAQGINATAIAAHM